MKTKLLKKLRDRHQIVWCAIDIIKVLYSVKPLNRYRTGDPEDAKWCSRSYDNAVKKQRELILQSLHNNEY